jgi:multidrug transporter EmrE-like cation transporter
LLLKLAVSKIGSEVYSRRSLSFLLRELLLSRYFWTGTVFFVGSMFLWLFVIARMELSRAYPTVSLSYFCVFAASVYIFGEAVTTGKIVGLAAILIGVALINR